MFNTHRHTRQERLNDLALTGDYLRWVALTEDRFEALEDFMVDISQALNDLDAAVQGVSSRIGDTLTQLQTLQQQLAATDPAAAQQLADAAAKIETEVASLNSLDIPAAATATPADPAPTDTTATTDTSTVTPPA